MRALLDVAIFELDDRGRLLRTIQAGRATMGEAGRWHLANAVMRGFEPADYSHHHNGSVASLGLYKGVAQVKGIKIKGFPAWFLHRTYHMTKVPTTRRKVAVVTDWTIAFLFKRDVTSLWSTHEPQRAFAAAARGDAPDVG